MKTVVISDIHGMTREFDKLLNTIIKKENVNQFVLAGDLLDKGYDSPGTVRLARQLFKEYPASILVKGNHEEKNERFRKRVLEGNLNAANKMKGSEEMWRITNSLSDEDISFLNAARLWYRVEEHHHAVVHAGIPPSINKLPTEKEVATSGRTKKHFHQLLRVRYVNACGSMIHLGKETREDKYWAELYDGRFGTVIFGHQPFMQDGPKFYDHAVGIDLGCVFGGHLCAYVLSEEGNYWLTVRGAKYAEPYSG